MRSGLHDSDVWSLYSVLHSLKSELKLLVFNGIHVIIDSELAMKNSCFWDKTRGDKNFFYTTHRKKDIKNDKSTYEALPGGGGGCPMSPVWILKRLVSVFTNACRLLSALPSLSQFGQRRMSLVTISFYALSLLFGPCRLSEFTLAGSHLCKVQAT